MNSILSEISNLITICTVLENISRMLTNSVLIPKKKKKKNFRNKTMMKQKLNNKFESVRK